MRLLLLAAGVGVFALALAQEPIAPVTAPDVRANIVKMLAGAPEEGTAAPSVAQYDHLAADAAANTDGGSAAPAAPPSEAPAPAVVRGRGQERREAPLPKALEVREDWFEGPLVGFRRDRSSADGHVPVPHRTITVQDLDDLDRLEEELNERARRDGR